MMIFNKGIEYEAQCEVSAYIAYLHECLQLERWLHSKFTRNICLYEEIIDLL